MTLLILFALLTFALFALFWGGSLVAQGYLYQQPADLLPPRAAVAAVIVAGYVTFWVWVDQRNPGKYDTFFEFAGETTRDITEFEAVRWERDPAAQGKADFKKDGAGKPAEKVVKFKRSAAGGKTAPFVEEGTTRPFRPNDTDMMTAALLVKLDDGGTPTRFNAELKKDERTGTMTYAPDRRFVDAGSRYVKADQPGVLYVPSTGVVLAALLVNSGLFAAWFAAAWPVLRFSWGHALAFTAVFGLVTMLVVLPLLFKPNRTPQAPAAAVALASRPV